MAEMQPYLYPAFPTRQASCLGATLNLLLMATAGHDSTVALWRDLVSHLKVRRRAHCHLLSLWGRRVGVVLRRHGMLGCVQRRAHVLRRLLSGRRWLLLAVLQAYWRKVQRRQRHVRCCGRCAVWLLALVALRRWVCVRRLHRGRWVRVRRGIGLSSRTSLLLRLVGHQTGSRWCGRGPDMVRRKREPWRRQKNGATLSGPAVGERARSGPQVPARTQGEGDTTDAGEAAAVLRDSSSSVQARKLESTVRSRRRVVRGAGWPACWLGAAAARA